MTSYDEVRGLGRNDSRSGRPEGACLPGMPIRSMASSRNDARLTDEEKQLIATWVDNGCPEGDRAIAGAARIRQGLAHRRARPGDLHGRRGVSRCRPKGPSSTSTSPSTRAGPRTNGCRPPSAGRAIAASCITSLCSSSRTGGDESTAARRLGGYAPGNAADVHPPGTATFVPAGSKLVFPDALHAQRHGAPRTAA